MWYMTGMPPEKAPHDNTNFNCGRRGYLTLGYVWHVAYDKYLCLQRWWTAQPPGIPCCAESGHSDLAWHLEVCYHQYECNCVSVSKENEQRWDHRSNKFNSQQCFAPLALTVLSKLSQMASIIRRWWANTSNFLVPSRRSKMYALQAERGRRREGERESIKTHY